MDRLAEDLQDLYDGADEGTKNFTRGVVGSLDTLPHDDVGDMVRDAFDDLRDINRRPRNTNVA